MRKLVARTVNASVALLLFGLATAGAQTVDPSNYEGKIRVACVGDSITFGAGIRDRGRNSYPAQLGRMLGEKWEVCSLLSPALPMEGGITRNGSCDAET